MPDKNDNSEFSFNDEAVPVLDTTGFQDMSELASLIPSIDTEAFVKVDFSFLDEALYTGQE